MANSIIDVGLRMHLGAETPGISDEVNIPPWPFSNDKCAGALNRAF